MWMSTENQFRTSRKDTVFETRQSQINSENGYWNIWNKFHKDMDNHTKRMTSTLILSSKP